MKSNITVYGTDWCEDTHATRQQLDRLDIPYQYVDVDQDLQAKAWIKERNNGKQQTPTVDLAGQILIEPDEQELEEALRDKRLMA